MFMPPVKYDKPYTGELIIGRVATQQEIRALCPEYNKLKTPATACTKTPHNDATRCYIFIVSDQVLKTIGSNYALVLRHELAHCNGWPADHAGGKKISISTRVELPKLPTKYLPLSPPTICVTPDWQPEPCESRATKDVWSTARPFHMNDIPKKVER
jgi:hypothetical protein